MKQIIVKLFALCVLILVVGACSTSEGKKSNGAKLVSSAVVLAKTGQTLCSDGTGTLIACAGTGQDGDTQAGVAWPAPRFTAGTGTEDGCVTDELTGLMWPLDAPRSGSWTEAMKLAPSLTLCGHSDWRVPNNNELRSLIHYGQSNSLSWLKDQGFSRLVTGGHWSSTTYAPAPGQAWIIDLPSGEAYSDGKSVTTYNILPVRAGQGTDAPGKLAQTGQTLCSDGTGTVIACAETGQDGDTQTGVAWPKERFTAGRGAEADCITDNLTGLMWVKAASGTTSAIDIKSGGVPPVVYAATVNDKGGWCGYTDWRMPNVNELSSLINAEQVNTAAWLISQGFEGVQAVPYFSSTTYFDAAKPADCTWFVDMSDGYTRALCASVPILMLKTGYEWPVRGGR